MFVSSREARVPMVLAALLTACGAESGDAPRSVTASSPEEMGAAGGAAMPAGDGATTPTFASALPDQSSVGELPATEWSALCDEIGTWTDNVFAVAPESTCLLGGLVLGGDPQNCETMVDSCLASADAPPPACDASLQAGCTATIGEIETCLNQVGSVIDALGSGVSCQATLDRAMLGSLLRPLTGATSCLSLQSTCPALSAAVMPGT